MKTRFFWLYLAIGFVLGAFRNIAQDTIAPFLFPELANVKTVMVLTSIGLMTIFAVVWLIIAASIIHRYNKAAWMKLMEIIDWITQ